MRPTPWPRPCATATCGETQPETVPAAALFRYEEEMIAFLEGFGLNGKKVLIVTEDRNENVYLSARNIQGVDVMRAQDLNTYEVLVHEHIILTKAALTKIQEVWG